MSSLLGPDELPSTLRSPFEFGFSRLLAGVPWIGADTITSLLAFHLRIVGFAQEVKMTPLAQATSEIGADTSISKS
jgi:hypothetical protein